MNDFSLTSTGYTATEITVTPVTDLGKQITAANFGPACVSFVLSPDQLYPFCEYAKSKGAKVGGTK